MLRRSTYIVMLLCNALFFTGTLALGLSLGSSIAKAACSPGIPCTPAAPDNFDLYSQSSAGTSSSYNGSKTGKNAGSYDESACDGNFMNQIYSKAYMEGHRQIIMSEQIIHKPDSVLEYTCFGGYLTRTATIESVFSYNDYWNTGYEQDRWTDEEDSSNPRVYTLQESSDPQRVYREDFNDDDTDCPPGGDPEVCANNLSEAINYIVTETLTSYLGSNFNHNYLGEATTLNPSGAPAGCADMATVWDVAKCLDFGEDDRFRTFEALVTGDPRSIPQECSPGRTFTDDVDGIGNANKLDTTTPGDPFDVITTQCPAVAAPVAGVNTNFSTALINVANNCANATGEHAYVKLDLVDYIDLITLGAGQNSGWYIPGTGGSTSGSVNCRTPIPTGIPVITYEYDSSVTGTTVEFFDISLRNKYVHYEHICTNPGCYYRPNSTRVSIAESAVIPAYSGLGDSFCAPY